MAFVQLHGVRPREFLDRVALGLAFAAGTAGTVFFKLTDAPVLLIAFFPVLVLLTYVLACVGLRSTALEPDIVGDNCYYLGFLFTLTSLGVTLYLIRDLSASGGASARATDLIPAVISGFGVALTSTITGVFLRVLLMQLRPDIVARDMEARRDLSQGAREFHLAVTQASRRIKDISIETVQHVAERNAKLDEITDRHASQVGELLIKQAQAFESTMQALAARLTDEIVSRISAEAQQASDRIQEAAGQVSDAMGQLAQAQEGSLARLDAAQSAVEAALGRWAASIDSQRTLSDQAAGAIASETRDLGNLAAAQRRAFQESIDLMLRETAALSDANEDHRRALIQRTEAMVGQSDAMSRQAEEMSQALAAQQSVARGASQALVEQSQAMEAAIGMAVDALYGAAVRVEEATARRITALEETPLPEPVPSPAIFTDVPSDLPAQRGRSSRWSWLLRERRAS
ncbi:hypothetical protein FHG66_11395 [Rubellimicrobium rubrum]|uniref:Uncharacterized protein n=1 Tax=Rubellimicrobium rubrum TaxID=2585369 RepID=A0A5C4MXI1_9RHOB|nr:hypothetical protein [Rubellimicrobium rubrum]TNC49329.1 hypothetical protein FHG66_11395 [Rubellimicrobium rubrum]